jgi:hypothetical protein
LPKPLADFAAAEEQLEHLRNANARLARQLQEAKASKAELVAAVYRAANDAAQGLAIPPVPKPKADRRKRREEVAVPLVSDLQLAKLTPDYDSDVCEERMERYARKVVALTDIQRADHPVRHAVVPVLGDVIEGEFIFPGQQWRIDASLFRQITVDGPRIIINFLRSMLAAFDTVEVVWVDGNHGRLGRKGDFHPESNGDRMLGQIVKDRLAGEPRLSWNFPSPAGERNWYAVTNIGAWSALCIHGDQIRGQYGFPFYGLAKKVNAWAAGAIREPFKDVLMGHWHQISSIPLNQRDVYVNGSTESYNTFAQEQLAAMSDPAQWLLFVDPDKGRVTAEYKVRLGV